MSTNHELSNFICSIADLLRSPYRATQYERVMLPLVVLRCFDEQANEPEGDHFTPREGREVTAEARA